MYKYFNSNEDLKKQYRELCKRLHPDHGGNEEDFKEMMAEYERIQLEGFKQQAREAGGRDSSRGYGDTKENNTFPWFRD